MAIFINLILKEAKNIGGLIKTETNRRKNRHNSALVAG